MFTVRGVDEGGLGGDLDRGPEQMQTYGVCRCWGCYSLVGSCMRSLLVFLSTEHLSSGGLLRLRWPLHGVGMIPWGHPLGLGALTEDRPAPRGS